ncbi:LysR family transcriptional regulator [Salinisphaera aquimarina]|uniref:LysR family transcriptional regulator n=1 Tax=Salinisphaera aquimarina TaxID=2094031 RepID=A0ABV7EKP5_9GAMM
MLERHIDPLGQISDFEVRLIRVFRAVVESGGFTAAMPALGIGRSAISLHMADLEARLGMRLCQRGRSGFALTEEGRDIYQASLRLLASLETFRNEVNSLHRHLRGELNIGITDNLVTLPHMRITHALAALKQRGPQVHINIHMIPPSEVEAGVMDGRLHVGVVPAMNAMRALDYNPLYNEAAYLYCARNHSFYEREDDSLGADDIAAADAVVPAYALPAAGQRCLEQLNGMATATDREGIAFLLLTGCYIGFLPEHFARRWADTGQLRRLCPDRYAYRIEYAAITRHGRRPHRVLDTLLAELGHPDSPLSSATRDSA